MAHGSTAERSETVLSERLQGRRVEIEQAVLTRVYAVSDPAEVMDPMYAEGLRAAVSAAVAYSIAAVELGEERSSPPPPMLIAQARLAARNGVGLDTVLRRYFAGHALIGDFLVEEAAQSDLPSATVRRLLRGQATLFERLLGLVSDEYVREAEGRLESSEERRAQRIERLLGGELLDTSEFGYDFEAFHLALIASGAGASQALRALVGSLDCRLLLVRRDEETAWAWLGSRRQADVSELERLVFRAPPSRISLAIGEPGEGFAGWRLSHQQAKAALPIALRAAGPFVRYSEVAVLASVLQDNLLSTSLRELYLVPLERDRDGGEAARKTLRAYFAVGRNISSAAAALGVNRHTVSSRLRAIEERLGRPIEACSPGLEIALGLRDLEGPTSSRA